MKLDPNDPILTAYALGELDGPDRQRLEASLKNSPEARQAIEDIQGTAQLLARELASEPALALTPEHRARIEAAAKSARPLARNIIPVPFWQREPFWWGFAAAACVAFMLIIASPLVKKQSAQNEPPVQLAKRELNELSTQPSGPGNQESQTTAVVGNGTFVQNQPQPAPAAPPSDLTVTPPNQAQVPVRMEPVLAARYGLIMPQASGQPSINGKRDSYSEGTSTKSREMELAGQPETAGPIDQDARARALTRRSRPGSPPVMTPLIDESRALDELGYSARPGVAAAEAKLPNTAEYPTYIENPFRSALDHPLSTFSIDVDTASYANVRRFLNRSQLPPRDAVRIEEMLNYFTYNYPQPTGPHPFSASVEVAGCPWNAEHRLVRVGLKGRELPRGQRPPSNFVFLVDVSGSMQPAERLPLVKQALRQLARQMTANDRVAIVVYANASGLALPSTPGAEKEKILAAIDRLEAGGSTNGGDGIQQAYNVATADFIRGGVNRVLLCTDGDFNVGLTDRNVLVNLIQEKARSGVFLTTLGVGDDNYKDALMQQLADKGNGNYHYLDTLEEAQKVLIEQMNATLVTIAKDVKIQIEFNPAQVSSYRLIGYEKRALRNRDFHDDRKDAGEIGAGHTVTALYEISPAGRGAAQPALTEPLKYQPERKSARGPGGNIDRATPVGALTPITQPVRAGVRVDDAVSRELLTLKLRYKKPDANESVLVEFPATDAGATFAGASGDFKFAAAVAQFGLLLKNSEFKGTSTLASVSEIARESKGIDPGGYRAEFINLVTRAMTLSTRQL